MESGDQASYFFIRKALRASKLLNDLKSLLTQRLDDYECRKLLDSSDVDMLEHETVR